MIGPAIALLQAAIAKAGEMAGGAKTPGRANKASGEDGSRQAFEQLLAALGEGDATQAGARDADPVHAAKDLQAGGIPAPEANVEPEIPLAEKEPPPGAHALARLDPVQRALKSLAASRLKDTEPHPLTSATDAVPGAAIAPSAFNHLPIAPAARKPEEQARQTTGKIGGQMAGQVVSQVVSQVVGQVASRDAGQGIVQDDAAAPRLPAWSADPLLPSGRNLPSDTSSKPAHDGAPTVPPPGVADVRTQTHLAPPLPIFSQLAGVICAGAQALTAGPSAPDPGPAAAIPVEAAAPFAANPVRVLALQLQPGDLGSVDIRLDLKGSALGIRLVIDKPATLAAVTRESSHLVEALRHSGYAVESLVIRQSTPMAVSSEASAQGGAPTGVETKRDQQDDNRGGPRAGERDSAPRQQDGRDQRRPARDHGDDRPRSGRYL